MYGRKIRILRCKWCRGYKHRSSTGTSGNTGTSACYECF